MNEGESGAEMLFVGLLRLEGEGRDAWLEKGEDEGEGKVHVAGFVVRVDD